MAINNQIIGGNFTDPQGNPLANGTLVFELSQDEQSSVPGQIGAGRKITVTLDNTGNVPASPAVYMFANDALNPANSFYTVWAYNANGQLVWGPQQQQVLSAPSPFNLNAWVPNSINTGSTPAPIPLLEHNGVANSSQSLLNLTGGGATTVSESGGTVTISSPPATGVTLKTNGVSNSSQTQLNLTGSGGATLAEAGGTVTINTPAVSVPGGADFAFDFNFNPITGGLALQLIGPFLGGSGAFFNSAASITRIDSSTQPSAARYQTGAGVGVIASWGFNDTHNNPFGTIARLRFRLQLTQTTNTRMFFGLTDSINGLAGSPNTDNPNNNLICFRYSSNAPDANWAMYCATSNAAFTKTVAAGSIDTNIHTFDIYYTPTAVNFYIDNVFVGTITTNIPAATVLGGPFISIANVSGGAVSFTSWGVKGVLADSFR